MSDESATATEGTAESSSKPGMVPVMVSILVGVLAGSASGMFVAGPMVAKKMHITAEAPKDSAAADSAAEAESAAAGAKEGGKEGAATTVHLIENLVLNPANSGGSRFLLVSVGLTMKSVGAAGMVKAQDAEVRDIVLRVLGSRSIDDLANVGNRDQLKKDILVAVDSLFRKQSVKSVYFPQFVIQ